MPDYFSVSPSQKGYVYSTDFVYTSQLPRDYTQFAWDLGNGITEYNKLTASATYQYPGLYTVSMSAWSDDGTILTDQTSIDVDYVLRDSLVFTGFPTKNGVPRLYSEEPFSLEVITTKIDQPIFVILQAFNTKSVPYFAAPEKWRFLVPTWKFVDTTTNELLGDKPILISTEPIYRDNKVVAVSGKASFYYVDDLSTGSGFSGGCPLMIAATLSTATFTYPPESLRYPYYSYSNSEVARAVIAWQIDDIIPTQLKITENYINEVYPVKWSTAPIPIMITCEFDSSTMSGFESLSGAVIDVFSYPRSNNLGSANRVRLTLSAEGGTIIPEDLYTVEVDGTSYSSSEAPLYFKATDENQNSTSGYIFTTITPLTSFNSNIVIAASAIAANQEVQTNGFLYPDGFPIFPDVYISHPEQHTINKINIVTYPATCEDLNYYKKLGVLVEGSASFTSVPILTTFDLGTYTLSGAAAVYGMAFSPIKNKLYAADADQDALYILDKGTNITKTVFLSSITQDYYNAPSCATIDFSGNVWFSMYGSDKLLKFDSNLNYLLSASPGLQLSNNTYYTTGTMEYPLFPPAVETDSEDNVWACYSYSQDSYLIKFDKHGNELFRATDLDSKSVPVSLSMDPNDDVWVACRQTNKLELYSGANGSLLKSIDIFIRPSYIALDRSGKIWVTHGYNFISVYDTITDEFKHFKLFSEALEQECVVEVNGYTQEDVTKATQENEIWGGLTVNVYDTVWIIDTYKSIVASFSVSDPAKTARKFVILPQANVNRVVLGGDKFMTEIGDTIVKSAQAGGDWSGNRWYQKYATKFASKRVKGASAPFSVYDINTSFNVAKTNESFNFSNHLKSLAFPETFQQSPKLFDEFLAAVTGDGNPNREDAGRIIYEKIANFTKNHADVETADINQLQSLAAQMAVDVNSFGSNFPLEINRLVHLFSIPKYKLRGTVDYGTDSYDKIGNLLTDTSIVSAGQKIVAKYRKSDSYLLVDVSPLYITANQTLSVYPLASLEVPGMVIPHIDNYYFFEYNEKQSGYQNNIIDWDSDYTTISYNLSSDKEWYGDNGLMEIMFNQILTKNLLGE